MRWLGITLSDILLYLILLFGPIAGGLVETELLAAAHVTITLLIALSLLTVLYQGRLRLRYTLVDLSLALFFFIAFVSACTAVYPHAARHELFRWVACAALFFFVVNTQQDTKKLLLLCWILVVSSSLHAVLGLMLTASDSRSGISLFFANHSHFSGYLEMLVWPAVGLAMISKGEKRILLFGMAVLLIAATVFSLSRGGIIGLVAGFCLYLAIFIGTDMEEHRGFRLLLVFVLFSTAVLIWFGLDPAVERMKTLTDPLIAGQGRFPIWQGTLKMIEDRPLIGWGPGCFPFAFPAYQTDTLSKWFVNHAHNDYLELAAETGIVGLTAALATGAFLFNFCLGRLLAPKYRYFQPVGAGALAGCFSLLVHSVTDFNVHIPSNAMLFAVMAGIAVLAAERASGQEVAASDIRLGIIGRLFGAIAVLLIAYLGFKVSFFSYLSASYADEASEYQQQEDYEPVVAALQQAMIYNPDNAELMERMGDLFMFRAWNGEQWKKRLYLRKALGWHEKAVAACPVSAEFMSKRAYLLGQLGRHEAEEQALKQALRLSPTYIFPNYGLATLCLRQGRLDEAFQYFRCFLQLKGQQQLIMVLDKLLAAGATLHSLGRAVPATAPFRRAFARYFTAQGKTDMALHELALAFVLEPSEGNALVQVQGLVQSKKLPAALVKTEEHLRRFPASLRLQEQKAVILEQLGRKIEAIFVYRKLLQVMRTGRKVDQKNAVRWYLKLTHGYAADRRHKEAVTVLKQGIRQYPREARLHYALSQQLQKLHKTEEALKELKDAVFFAPNNIKYQYRLGMSYLRMKLYQNAAEAWSNCLAVHPNAASCRTALDRLEKKLGLQDELIRYERGLLPAFSNQEEAVKYFLHIADLYGEKNQSADAVAVLHHGIEKYPDEARFHYALGKVLDRTGKEKEALESLQKAVFFRYDKATYRYTLGKAYQRRGLHQQAAEEWRICLTIQPDYTECQNALKELEMKR
ncbi:MAG: O-antigen ligase family protein [Candidatus Electrothrix gigas]